LNHILLPADSQEQSRHLSSAPRKKECMTRCITTRGQGVGSAYSRNVMFS